MRRDSIFKRLAKVTAIASAFFLVFNSGCSRVVAANTQTDHNEVAASDVEAGGGEALTVAETSAASDVEAGRGEALTVAEASAVSDVEAGGGEATEVVSNTGLKAATELSETKAAPVDRTGKKGGYIEMPWDKGHPKTDPSISFERARDLLTDSDAPAPLGGSDITDEEPAAAYPASYQNETDIRNYLSTYLTPLKNQSPFGTCWAQALIANMESYLIKHSDTVRDRNGIATRENTDYSEMQLAYFYFHNLANPMVGAQGDKFEVVLDDGSENMLALGGNFRLATQAMMNGVGLTDEELFPYVYGNKIAASEEEGNLLDIPDELAFDNNAVRLKNSYEISITNNPKKIKQAIMSNGAVATAIHYNKAFCDADNSSYYCPEETDTNHSIAIVGWDDNFPKEKFKGSGGEPESNGAWLIRNSWQDERRAVFDDIFTCSGYFWLSYCDKSIINETAYVLEAVSADEYDHCYSYTPLVHNLTAFLKNDKWANIYTAKDDEILKAVSFETYDNFDGGDYQINIYKDFTQDEGSIVFHGEPLSIMKGTIVHPGLYTIDLDKPVQLEAGEKFAIEIEGNDPYLICFECDMTRPIIGFISSVAINEGESYCRMDDDSIWEDMASIRDDTWGNFMINALTIDEVETTGIRGFVWTDSTKSSVSLKWESLNEAGGYRVYRRDTASDDFTLIGTTEAAAYTDENLAADSTYYYYIVPLINDSPDLSRKSCVLLCQTAPEEIRSVPVTYWTNTEGDEFVIWIDPASEDVDACMISYNKADGEWNTAYANYNYEYGWYLFLEDLGPEKYQFKARFIKENALEQYMGPESEVRSRFGAPGNLIGDYDGSKVTLSWNKVEGADYYKIYKDGEILGYVANPFCSLTPDSSGTSEYTVRATREAHLDLSNTWDACSSVTVDTSEVNYAVRFESNGGSTVSAQNVAVNGRAERPEDPIREGYKFKGWYKDSDLTEEYNFNSTISERITLYAKWEECTIRRTVTFKVEKGSWNDGSTEDVAVTLAGSDGDILKLTADQIPEVGKRPDTDCKAGSWNTAPDTDTEITGDTSYTYTYVEKTAPGYTAPTPLTLLSYNGAFQTLVTGGTSTGGTMKYALGANGTSAPTKRWSASIPTAANSGSYYVWYKVEGDGDYKDTEPDYVMAVMDKVDSSMDVAPEAVTGLVYSRTAQILLSEGSGTGGTVEYALGDSPTIAPDSGWTEDLPKATAVGEYNAWYRLKSDKNHNDLDPVCVKVSIAEKAIEDLNYAGVADQAYTGEAIEPGVKVTHGGNTLIEGTDYRLSYSNNINVTDKALIKVTGIGNYKGSKEVTFKIVKAGPGADFKKYVSAETVSEGVIGKTKVDVSTAFEKAKASSDYDSTAKHRYASSNRKIATVNKKGLLSAKKSGEVDITLEQKKKGGDWTAIGDKLHLDVQVPVMEKKVTKTLSLENLPDKSLNAYDFLTKTDYAPTQWVSSNPKVAMVDEDGTITILKKGSTSIIAQYGSGKTGSKKKYKTKLKVKIKK
ncbi:MAG: InlB B-repeat-containing protein [Lachnospiraceae bacterium]|nr:InlB B-repeat-containing protein [Lachnospiraceae bacterium]